MVPAARAMEDLAPGAEGVEAGAVVAVPAEAAATPAPGAEDHPATRLVIAVLALVPKLFLLLMMCPFDEFPVYPPVFTPYEFQMSDYRF